MVKSNWVYNLRKDDLVFYAEEFGLETSGTVDDLRKRFVEFIRGEEHEAEVLKKLEVLEEKYNRGVSPAKQEPIPCSSRTVLPSTVPRINITGTESTGEIFRNRVNDNQASTPYSTQQRGDREEYLYVIEQVRKWPLKFDGSKDPIAWLERIEELAEVYEIRLDLLPRTMPELLKEFALMWFRNNNRRWSNWSSFKGDFLKFFLPAGYIDKLEDGIRARKQREGEKFKSYMVELQDLMRQAGYSEEQMLERLYTNSLTGYRRYIRRRDFHNLQEFMQLADDYEELQMEDLQNQRTVEMINMVRAGMISVQQANRTTHFNPKLACRRCGQEGHRYKFCRNEQQLFCWDCGKEGVKSIECCRKHVGNGVSSSRVNVAGSERTGQESIYMHEGHMFARIRVGYQEAKGLVDTGASRSFISSRCAEKLVNRVNRFQSNMVISLADGTMTEVREGAEVYLTCGNKMVRMNLLILPSMVDDLILGMDFLTAINATLICGGQIFELGNRGRVIALKTVRVRSTGESESRNSGGKSGDGITGKSRGETGTRLKQYTNGIVRGNMHCKVSVPKDLRELVLKENHEELKADALSREPLNILCTITEGQEQTNCAWLERKKMEILENPEKFSDYMIENGQLYRHIPSRGEIEGNVAWKLCVPKHLRERVLKESHDEPSAGHMGVRKTIARVCKRYYWPGLFRDVSKYVRKCESCQRYKVSQQKPAGMMLTQIPEEPWGVVCADFVGPLPRSTHGNSMLLVFFDKFSKWTELIPVRKATSEAVQKALRERIICRFGVPKSLVTDNGTQFTSRTFKRFLAEFGISHRLTAPYTPQENPTERVNRTVKTMIGQYAGDNQRTWDDRLPEIMLAVNSSVSEVTGYSPSFIIQGREPRLPGMLYDEVTGGTGSEEIEPNERATMLKEIFELVKRNLEVAAQDQRRYYNLRRREWKPRKGERVLVKQHHLSKAVEGFAAKLAPRYDGPYEVKGFISPVIVEIIDEHKRKRTAHVGELKPFNVE